MSHSGSRQPSDGDKSRGRGREQQDSALTKALTVYRFALRTNPMLVKGVTSGMISALGNVVAQLISPQGPGGKINWRSVASFGAFNAVVTGPLTHHLYRILEGAVPRNMKYAAVYRVAIDRLLFAPPYLMVFFFVVALLEGLSVQAAIQRIRGVFWTALKMNWKVWTLAQYINFSYVPTEYRVLFANVISFLWNIYLAYRR
ncbi:peroxisomal membrane protein 2-like [Sycon ciliatum]|uniref:peroxisomal membrane protein 2-like n=1 Tax=Sycon ciliatum TaxID=27933 RepID=UPI0020ABADDA|eukprot:scpid77492/ scgid29229/ Peroxisomal membrane protein 2; 22 kDa peroxisomal membrane protein